ncbi:kinase-like protein [Punctularia strigosozonata HHB-11173 SS5]|uniref:Kinase-like protein n=1 Tax=Punctularia strigosozonata (strain HHB-11173) TaxID=741275 RepID=R7S1U4_PUNST|nr:kinase-like protein [Punctularia strigosozonata HHB-11173 SS5]EIN03829.1 kinase-like protein [Punctularia strigosozonata HHB-11173 SS5]
MGWLYGMRATTAVAKTAVDLSGVPYLSTALAGVQSLLELCEKVGENREASRRLAQQCNELLVALHRRNQYQERISYFSWSLKRVLRDIEVLIQDALRSMEKWTSKKTIVQFARLKTIENEINGYAERIDKLMQRAQLVAHLDTQDWLIELHIAQQRDQLRVLGELRSIGERLDIYADAIDDLAGHIQVTSRSVGENNEIVKNMEPLLYDLLTVVKQRLPNPELNDYEIRKLGEYEIRSERLAFLFNGYIEWYRGEYLGKGQVILKCMRVDARDEPKILKRFGEECRIWKKVYAADKGEHILPYWGYSHGPPGPFIVSPFMPDGTVVEYLEAHPDADRLELIKGIARCLKVLHDLKIVHGYLRVDMIQIDTSSGRPRPLISDFGLAKIISDTVDAQFTLSTTPSARWLAPELVVDKPGEIPQYRFPVDIFSFGMTALEILSGVVPYDYYSDTRVVVAKFHGELPRRPEGEEVMRRGLGDGFWQFLLDCWEEEPTKRPTIDQVIVRLDEFTDSSSGLHEVD